LGSSQTGWLEGDNSAFTLGDEIKIIKKCDGGSFKAYLHVRFQGTILH
jgi:hypothetical protein